MHEKMLSYKTSLAAALTALVTFLGWKGIMLTVWVGVMALDYLSGTLAACREGHWNSAAARQGLWHKGGMIIVVTVAAISDAVMVMLVAYVPLGMDWPGLMLPLVLAWYIITELGSILENAVKMGAKVPGFLLKVLQAGIRITENAADASVDTSFEFT